MGVVASVGCDDSSTNGDGDGGGGGGDGGDVTAPDLSIPAVPAPYGLDSRPSNTTCLAPARPIANTKVQISRVYPNLSFPNLTDLAQAPGDNSTWYVVQKNGLVKKFPNTANPATTDVKTYADITARVNNNFNESGLLSIAFHPKFATNKQVYLFYSAFGPYNGRMDNPNVTPNIHLRSTIAKFLDVGGVLDTGAGKDTLVMPPDDSGTATTPGLLDKPYDNHNGGNVKFGPDGFLYAGFGDGGSGGDPLGNGQNTNVLLAKIVRVDVDNIPAGKRYGIPATNPFANGGGRPEIFAYGLRNPWRWSFDRATGDLWVADVGQDAYEEIDIVKLGGNYGWNKREGFHCYSPMTNCPTAGLIDPILEYAHNGQGKSITGGFVYHGKAMPELSGAYFYADEVNGELYILTYDAMGVAKQTLVGNVPGGAPTTFAEDQDGEVYVGTFGGAIYKLGPMGAPQPDTFPKTLSQTGCVDKTDPTKPAAGLVPYGVNSALWSDGATKRRWIALPDDGKVTIGADGDFDFPNGTVAMKEFTVGGKRVETRLLMKHPDGIWAGYSYEWRDDGSDADLLPAGKTKSLGTQSWTYPNRNDCLVCHTLAAGRTLGLEVAQQNGDFTYESTLRISNQLATLDHIGLFATAPGDPTMLPALAHVDDAQKSLDDRARGYLHSNCSICHRPMGTGQGPQDLRFSTTFKATMLCNTDPSEGNLGVTGSKLIVPGDPTKSIVSLRVHALDANRMPPLATAIVDPVGSKLLDDWITSLTTCP